MTESTIVKTVFFAADRETVWDFLTKKDKLALWFHPPEADLVEGEPYALMGTADDGSPSKQCWGDVIEMKHPAKLVYSFTVKPLNGVMTTVTWTLVESHGGTQLTLTHEGVGAAGEAALGLLTALDAGWDEHVGKLRAAAKLAA